MLIPDQPHEFLTEFLPTQYAIDKRYPRTDTYPTVLEIADEGAWTIQVRNGALNIEKGRLNEPTLQVGVAADAFEVLFVARTRSEAARHGRLRDDTRSVFLPFFVDEKKRSLLKGQRDTLALRLKHDGRTFPVLMTPGNHTPAEPRATVSLALDDFFGMTAGKKKAPMMLLKRQLKVGGDVGYALKMNGLLS